jgi:hypothetical protein
LNQVKKVITRTWTATDCKGQTDSKPQIITVKDTQAPTLTAPISLTLECGSPSDPQNTGVATATDCGTATVGQPSDSIEISQLCAQNKIIRRTWTATDECGNTATGVQTISIVDTKPPVVTVLKPQTYLWPVNHKYACFSLDSLITATDSCGTVTRDTATCTVNQCDDAPCTHFHENGDGNTANDCAQKPTLGLCARAERAGSVGPDAARLYKYQQVFRDACGNTATGTAHIIVPHDRNDFPGPFVAGTLQSLP